MSCYESHSEMLLKTAKWFLGTILFLFVVNFSFFAWSADRGLIRSGETGSGGIAAPSFMDSWKFYGEAGDRVVVNAVATSGELNTYIDLYSPTGLKEDSSAPWYDQLSSELEETGLYTILVQDYGLNHSGAYSISLTKIPSDLRPGIYNPSPQNGEIGVRIEDFFTWDPVPGAIGYDLYFGQNVTEALKKIGDYLPSTSLSFPLMKLHQVYYWHVVAHTPSGDIEGPYWWFQTIESSDDFP